MGSGPHLPSNPDVCPTQEWDGRADTRSVPTPRRSLAVATATLAFALAPAAQAHAGLLDGLLGGGAPAPTTVSPTVVTSLVGQLGTVPGLTTPQVTAAVTDLLAGGVPADLGVLQGVLPDLSSSLSSGSPTALVAGLLGQGVPAGSIVSLVDTLLSGVADPSATVSAVVGQLLGAGLPADPAALDAVLAALRGGAAPTGNLLDPVAGVLDVLAANAALPAEARASLADLSATVRSAGAGVLGDDVLGQVSGVLGVVGSALGTGSPVKEALNGLAGLLPGKATTTTTKPPSSSTTTAPTAGGPGRRGALDLKDVTATVSALKIDKARRVAKVTLRCPKQAFVPCTVRTAASVDGLRSGKAVKMTLKAGAAKVVSFKLPAVKARKLGRRGGRLSVRAVTSYAGYQLGTASRAVKVSKRRR